MNMTNLMAFPGHKKQQCEDKWCGGDCYRCTLFICATCHGAEASLPTHCPGTPMDFVQQQMVQDGHADYKDGTWSYWGYKATEVFDG